LQFEKIACYTLAVMMIQTSARAPRGIGKESCFMLVIFGVAKA